MNILSYVNKPICGAEIKAWISEHTSRDTEYSRIARSMLRFMNIRDDALYFVIASPSGTGCGEKKKGKPILVKRR